MPCVVFVDCGVKTLKLKPFFIDESSIVIDRLKTSWSPNAEDLAKLTINQLNTLLCEDGQKSITKSTRKNDIIEVLLDTWQGTVKKMERQFCHMGAVIGMKMKETVIQIGVQTMAMVMTMANPRMTTTKATLAT